MRLASPRILHTSARFAVPCGSCNNWPGVDRWGGPGQKKSLARGLIAAVRGPDGCGREINAGSSPGAWSALPLRSCFEMHYLRVALSRSGLVRCAVLSKPQANQLPGTAGFRKGGNIANGEKLSRMLWKNGARGRTSWVWLAWTMWRSSMSRRSLSENTCRSVQWRRRSWGRRAEPGIVRGGCVAGPPTSLRAQRAEITARRCDPSSDCQRGYAWY
jgi:hypothetical protein